MKLIRIVSGNYGHREGKRLRVKTAQSEPFYVEDAEAERLEKLDTITIEIVGEQTGQTGQTERSEDESDADGDEEMKAALEAELKGIRFDNLKAIAAEMGIDTSHLKSRVALTEAIVNAELKGADLPEWAQKEAVKYEL